MSCVLLQRLISFLGIVVAVLVLLFLLLSCCPGLNLNAAVGCGAQSKFVEELAQQGRIRELILDQYANYVVQRALTVANNEEGLKLVNAIRPHLHSMQVCMVWIISCIALYGIWDTVILPRSPRLSYGEIPSVASWLPVMWL